MTTLNILYQDENLVVIDKPAGMLTHKSKIARDGKSAMELLRDQLQQWVYPIHRLDRPTSGILVFALSKESAQKLHESLAQGLWNKTYQAIVRGYVDTEVFIDHPLKKKYDRLSDGKIKNPDLIQEAQTQITPLAKVELPFAVGRYQTSRYSLLSASPHTGRRHQIRRHLAHIAHPIIGDTTYGRTEHNRFFQQQFHSHRLLLAATQLSFPHPYTQKDMTMIAPLTGHFREVSQTLFNR